MKFTITANETHEFMIQYPRPIPDDTEVHEWTLLEFNQCPGCKLDSAHRFCPLAIDSKSLFERFANIVSTEQMRITYENEGVSTTAMVDSQTAIAQIFQVYLLTSQCPNIYGEFNKENLLKLFVPLANMETVRFMEISGYMLQSYCQNLKAGKSVIDMNSIRKEMEASGIIVRSFLKRIRAIAKQDSDANAVVIIISLLEYMMLGLDFDAAAPCDLI